MTEAQSATLDIHAKASKQLLGLEPRIMAKAFKFQIQFRRDINHPSLRFKRLKGYQGLYSARVADDYRALLHHVGNNRYLLLAVLPRRDVYERLTERLAYFVNPTTGGVEVVDPSELAQLGVEPGDDEARRTRPKDSTAALLFDPFTDAELREVGVAVELIPSVRGIRTETGLFRLAEALPAHSAEVLVELACGTPLEVVLDKITAPVAPEQPVDPTDFAAAVDRPTTQAVSSDDPAVQSMLSGDFQSWCLFLHPSQRSLVERVHRGPARVSGGPGTGKTVVALHRAANLARKLDGDHKILLTTYTANLAVDLAAKLATLLTPEQLERVETVHVDKLAYRIAAESGPMHETVRHDGPLLKLWRQVLHDAAETDVDAEFCLDEWREVLCRRVVTTSRDYLTMRRSGRGRRLNRAQRIRIWSLAETFTEQLARAGLQTFEQTLQRAAVTEEQRLDTATARYRHVVVDEAQDLTPAHWRLLRALAPKEPDDLFIVGDTHQRIYGVPISLAPLGIDIRGRSSRLSLNYRTTREILGAALGLISGESFDDLDGDTESLAGYRSIMTGRSPQRVGTATAPDELEAIVAQVRRWDDVGPAEIAVCAPTDEQVKRIAAGFGAAGIGARVITKSGPPKDDVVHVSTMNRLKGLEYRRVIIAGVGAAEFPRAYASRLRDSDALAYRQALKRELCLLFVAATRARDALTIIWHGEPCQFLYENHKGQLNAT